MKRDDCRYYAANLCSLPLRVVKNQFEYIMSERKRAQEPTVIASIYFTNVVPVRPGLHYKRWGRWMPWFPTSKFRLDGRRNPPIEKCYKTRGFMTTQ